MEEHVMSMHDLPVMPDRIGLLENDLRVAQSRLKMMLVLWWVLFILLILGVAGVIGWSAWENYDQRELATENGYQWNKRMDDVQQRAQEAGMERVKPIEARLDVISQQLGTLQSDVGGIKVRQEMLQSYNPAPQNSK